jgi:hypothetical protein
MAKGKENGLVNVFYIFIALVFLAGIYACFFFVFNTKKSPGGKSPGEIKSIVVQKQTLNSPQINLSVSPAASLSPGGSKSPGLSAPTSGAKSPGNSLAKSTPDASCPNLLVKKGNQLLLYNKNAPEQFGVNPKIFNDMDEYIYYVKSERSNTGVDCPILYLQQESNAQGEDVFRIRAGPFDLDSGMPATIGYSDGVPIKAAPLPSQTLAPIVRTTFPNTTGSMPTTFQSNQSSNSSGVITNGDASNVMKTGTFFNNAGITSDNGFGPVAFNQTNVPSIGNPVPSSLQNPNQLSIPVPPVQQQVLPPVQTQPQVQGQPPVIQQIPPSGAIAPMPQPLVNGQQIVEQPEFSQMGLPLQPLIPPMSIPPMSISNNSNAPVQKIPVKYADSSRDHPPFNQNFYPGFDPYNQYPGVYTTLDQIHDSTINQNPTLGLSDNPMDPNWGGVMFTRRQVNTGKYDDNIET